MKPIQTGTERRTAAAVMVLGSVSEVLKRWVCIVVHLTW